MKLLNEHLTRIEPSEIACGHNHRKSLQRQPAETTAEKAFKRQPSETTVERGLRDRV